MGYSPGVLKGSDTTEKLTHFIWMNIYFSDNYLLKKFTLFLKKNTKK